MTNLGNFMKTTTIEDKKYLHRYSLRCQVCNDRFHFECKFENTKRKNQDIFNTCPSIIFETDTKQKINLFRYITIKYLINYYWKLNCKKMVRQFYGAAKFSREGKLICDNCYKIHQLKQ